LEIAAGTYEGPVGPDPFEVYVWEIDGSVVGGFPVSTSGVVKAAVALGDVDADDEVEIVATAYYYNATSWANDIWSIRSA
jgi:hypothetical protein